MKHDDEVVTQQLSAQEWLFSFRAMASPCEIRLEHAARSAAAAAVDLAICEVRRIEKKYSRYLHDSIVSRINAGAGQQEPIRVDDETAQLIDFALALHHESGGLFDITSGVLRRVWDFKQEKVATQTELEALLPLVDSSLIEWDGQRFRLAERGMEIDFGGFGKEYAADRAAATLQSNGIVHGFVNFGGDLRAVGPRVSGDPWSIGIQHPRETNGTIAAIEIAEGALATSGDYERFFERDGMRYCHLLNPRSGQPVRHWQSISVVAPVCTAAGALATIAMLKEIDAVDFLEQQQCGYLAIRNDGERFSKNVAATSNSGG